MNKLVDWIEDNFSTKLEPHKVNELKQVLEEHAANKEGNVELKSRMRVDGSFKRMQPVLNKESGMLSISQEGLIKELEDKRLCKFSNLDETMYSLSLKHTAEHLLDKFLITPLSTSPK